jgi:hypothetical protein
MPSTKMHFVDAQNSSSKHSEQMQSSVSKSQIPSTVQPRQAQSSSGSSQPVFGGSSSVGPESSWQVKELPPPAAGSPPDPPVPGSSPPDPPEPDVVDAAEVADDAEVVDDADVVDDPEVLASPVLALDPPPPPPPVPLVVPPPLSPQPEDSVQSARTEERSGRMPCLMSDSSASSRPTVPELRGSRRVVNRAAPRVSVGLEDAW